MRRLGIGSSPRAMTACGLAVAALAGAPPSAATTYAVSARPTLRVHFHAIHLPAGSWVEAITPAAHQRIWAIGRQGTVLTVWQLDNAGHLVATYPFTGANAAPRTVLSSAPQNAYDQVEAVSQRDGTLWFVIIDKGAEAYSRTLFPLSEATFALGHVTPSGVISLTPLVSSPGQAIHLPAGELLTGLTTGPEGNVWFSDRGEGVTGQGAVGRVVPATGQTTTFPLGGSGGIASGEGHLWIDDGHTLTTFSSRGEVTKRRRLPGGRALELAFAPDHSLWITDSGYVEKLARGVLHSFRLPYRGCELATSLGFAQSATWFLASSGCIGGGGVQGDQLGRISPSGELRQVKISEEVKEYGNPFSSPEMLPAGSSKLWLVGLGVVYKVTVG